MPFQTAFISSTPLSFPIQLRLHNRRPKLCCSADPILEGDLILYRTSPTTNWTLAAVIEPPTPTHLELRPVIQRHLSTPPNPLELFVDWTASNPPKLVSRSNLDILPVDADFEQRIITDRLENPHGEVSEPCWRVKHTQLTPHLPNIPSVN